MSVNMTITLSLTVALAFVLLMRRSFTSRMTSWTERLARRRTRSSNPGTPATGEAPQRMRPRLALSVSGVPSHESVRSAQDPPITDETVAIGNPPSASAPPDLLNVQREALAFEYADAGRYDHAVIANGEPVDAPGWPSPGELAVTPKLDTSASPPAQRFADTAVHEKADPVVDAARSSDIPSGWTDDDDRSGSTVTVPSNFDWDQSFAPESAGDSVATLALPTATDATVWDELDEDPAETADGAQQEWNAAAWEWTASGPPRISADWAAPAADDPSQQDDPGDPAATALSPESPSVGIVDVPMWSLPADSAVTPPLHPATDYERVIAATVRPLLAATGTVGASAPVIVVVIPQTRGTPSDREDELARTVRRLEKRVAALTDPKPIVATRPNQVPRTKRPAAKPTIVFTLTKAEARTLRSLAARHSAPIATRRRARIVLATARGLNVAAIAMRVGVHRTTVRRWQLRFAAKRLAALNHTSPSPPKRRGTITHHE